MAPKPQKPKPKQDNRVLTPARRAVLYDQWLGGRSLEELSAKWRKPIHRINEALTMERAERKVAQALKDIGERKANHEVVIEPPNRATELVRLFNAMNPEELRARATPEIIESAAEPNGVVEFRDPTTGERLGAIINVAAPEPARPVADLIEDAIKRRLG